jgi:CRP-like cAMP-binding protein
LLLFSSFIQLKKD